MIRIAEFAHALLLEKDLHDKTTVDMTAGLGQDTLFLAKISRHVYAFDIQKEAIEATSSLLQRNKIANVTLIMDDHVNVAAYVKEKIAGAIYNLGYLPGGDKKIMTTAKSTIASLTDLLQLLDAGGLVVIVVYEKHNPEESMKVLRYVERLSSREYDVMKHSLLNKELSPYIIRITKLINPQ